MDTLIGKAEAAAPAKPRRLRDEMRDVMTLKRYKRKSIEQYLSYCIQFAAFHHRDPREMREPEIQAFLTHLAVEKKVAWSTQHNAMCAIVCLYREVLKIHLGDFGQFTKAALPQRLPIVISQPRTFEIIAAVAGEENRLVCRTLYGCGLRIQEGIDLRVQEIDFERGTVTIRGPKQDHDRQVMLPESLRDDLQAQIGRMKYLWQQDGQACVHLPDAIGRKYPAAEREFGWQYVFGARGLSVDPDDGRLKRWHIHKNTIQKAVAAARYRIGMSQRFTPHCFRHCFGTHLYEAGTDIYRIQKLMGHKKIETTMIYVHLARKPAECIKSPLDYRVEP